MRTYRLLIALLIESHNSPTRSLKATIAMIAITTSTQVSEG